MTRDGTVGRFRRNRAKPGVSSGHRSRLNDEDSVRGPHQGQQSTRTAPTGRTHDCKRPLRCTPNDLLQGGGHPHMKRREFITLVGGAAVAWPRAARAQQPGRTYRLGFLLAVARDAPAMIAFFDELRVHGFVEGQNLAIIPRGFEAGNNQIDDLVPALIKAAPDAIIAGGDVIPRALQNATRTIPIVVITEVAAGFAASLARPGGNITGISLMSPDLDGKRQDILIE